MKRSDRFVLPLAIAVAWLAAGSTLLPLPIAVVFGALCVLALPGLVVERLLHGTMVPDGIASVPARSVTLSVALIALLGLVVSASGADIHALLLALAVASIALAVVPVHEPYTSAASPDAGATDGRDERAARTALVLLVVVAVTLAAAAPNVARDRMWYLAFVTQLASGTPIDWSEPFLGTGAIAARFAYNGWLLALGAWSSLTGATPSVVFERLAPVFLTLSAASAAWHFGRRTVPSAPGLAALGSMAAMLATRFPFFSPDRYPFFARIAEDKSAALLVFAPVALVAVADAVDGKRRASATAWVSLALTLVAVAFGHGLVMLFVGIAITFLLVSARAGGAASTRRALAAIVLAAMVAAVPGRMAMLARDRIVDVDEPGAAWRDDVTHPVVRAHLRLERTRDLPLGGPIVEPNLVADPLLVAGLAGILVAWRKRREMGAALLAAASIPFLAIAFVPFVAPLFGKIVLPWMAYRALWLIPFGSLLAMLLAALPRNATGTLLRGGTALALLAMALAVLPWNRTSARSDVVSPLSDRDTREVLARIAALPLGSRIAAAPGFAELIPALAGRPVVAVADRGTFVFAGTHAAAEQRLRASAALVGLAPGSPRVRRAEASRGGATHFVTHGRACGRVGRELFRSGPLRLCEVAPASSDARFAERLSTSTTGERDRDTDWAVRAAIGAGIACNPVVERDGDVYRWRRESRWTARPVAIRCRAKLEPPAMADLSLTFAAELPRARETLILRAVFRTTDGRKVVRHAAATLAEGVTATVALPGAGVRAVRLRLTPAHLPYLSLRELLLRERRDVGE